MDLIDRAAEMLLANNIPDPNEHDVGMWLFQELEQLPTVDAAPVVHGKWVFDHMLGEQAYLAVCSECGFGRVFASKNCESPYCEKCGAKMDKEENDG